MADSNSIFNIFHKEEFIAKYIGHIMSHCANTSNPDNCWIWQLSLHDGYGAISYQFYVDVAGKQCRLKKYTKSHRLMFAVYYDKLYLLHPDNQEIQCSHLCHYRACCNPRHIELSDNAKNGDRSTCKHYRTKETCRHQPPCML